jgi:hypothetical protein
MLQKCMALSVLSSWMKSRRQDLVNWHQKFLFHPMMSIRILVLPWWQHALCVNCSHLPSNLIMWSKLPSLLWTKDPLCHIWPLSSQESSTLPCRPTSSRNYWFIITKPYQVVPHLITSWSLIILSSLKPMANFARWICLIICACLVYRVAHLCVTPLSMVLLSQSLHW